MSKLTIGTEVWADVSLGPNNIAVIESGGRPGVVMYVMPDEEPDYDEMDAESNGWLYGWNSDDVVVRWANGAERTYQYKHITPFNPDDELDWDYEEQGQDPLYGDKPWLPEPKSSPYLDELRVRHQRIDDGLFALSQVDVVYPDTLDKVRSARDYVAAQIEQEKEKINA